MLYRTVRRVRSLQRFHRPQARQQKILRWSQRRSGYTEQLRNAVFLLDYSFVLLVVHRYLHTTTSPLHGPYTHIPCRDTKDYYAFNFNQF